MLEEKVYENQVKNLLMGDEEILNSKLQTGTVSSSGTTKRSRSSRRLMASQKVRLKRGNHLFGFGRLSLIFLAVILLTVLIQAIYYWMVSPKADKVMNLLKIYILHIELWSSLATVHTAAFETILWNNTVPMWNMESLKVYELSKEHLQHKVIDNLTEALEYDLGNYTGEFRNLMLRVSKLK